MSFRDFFLSKIQERTKSKGPTGKPIFADKLQAFTKKEVETSIQLYQHLKNMGNTFEDLIAFVEMQRVNELNANRQSAIKSAIFLTREERKHMKHMGGKRRQ